MEMMQEETPRASRRVEPLELIPFGDEITAAVTALAQERGLTYECCYRGLPVWIILESAAIEGKVRSLRVVAYLAESPRLSFVPSVEVFLGHGRALVPRHCPTTYVEPEEVLVEGQFDAVKFSTRLAQAWEERNTFVPSQEDMVEVVAS